jgi:hypothetical protein
MEKEFSLVELERQDAQLLPERETLCFGSSYSPSNWAGVNATNQALALNAGTASSSASAVALQGIFVTQS